MRDKTQLALRNQRIGEEVDAMYAEKSVYGSKKYTSEYIFDTVAHKYGLQSKTVRNIYWPGNSTPPVPSGATAQHMAQ